MECILWGAAVWLVGFYYNFTYICEQVPITGGTPTNIARYSIPECCLNGCHSYQFLGNFVSFCFTIVILLQVSFNSQILNFWTLGLLSFLPLNSRIYPKGPRWCHPVFMVAAELELKQSWAAGSCCMITWCSTLSDLASIWKGKIILSSGTSLFWAGSQKAY